jgi:hypothetical protein
MPTTIKRTVTFTIETLAHVTDDHIRAAAAELGHFCEAVDEAADTAKLGSFGYCGHSEAVTVGPTTPGHNYPLIVGFDRDK